MGYPILGLTGAIITFEELFSTLRAVCEFGMASCYSDVVLK
jgi:hypothetical protein